MSVSEGIMAGLLAGTLMAAVAEIGYRVGLLRSSLLLIDGSFAARRLGREARTWTVYALGLPVHLATSASFGLVYAGLAHWLDFDVTAPGIIALYVAVLWLSMLCVALPVAGQGFLGRRIGHFAWMEQLVLHVVFGAGFWWALDII